MALDLQHDRRHRAGPEQLGERARAEVAHAERRRAPGAHRLLHRSPHGAHRFRVADGPVEHEQVSASAAELGETAVGSEHYQALFTLGILLFVVTFCINLTADLVVRGIRRS